MDIIMPKMGESINEGTIIKWHKKKGDAVKRDEIIFEISTDKVDSEIPSPAEGVLSEIRFNEGDTVEVGTVVAVIDSAEDPKDSSKQSIEENAPSPAVKIPEQESVAPKVTEEVEVKIQKEIQVQDEKNNGTGELIEIIMPKMGESVMEGTIIKWHKKVGEAVKKDETIFEISTD
ncbi:MAG: 2-oxoglutarate dehydrogenase, partial [Ignavibacteriaceae bacterium]|nr:2-oxoglutarate dehydrogenase [Ignavibacteriaceae bacterium]